MWGNWLQNTMSALTAEIGNRQATQATQKNSFDLAIDISHPFFRRLLKNFIPDTSVQSSILITRFATNTATIYHNILPGPSKLHILGVIGVGSQPTSFVSNLVELLKSARLPGRRVGVARLATLITGEKSIFLMRFYKGIGSIKLA